MLSSSLGSQRSSSGRYSAAMEECRTGGKHSDVGVIGLATATPEEAEEYDSSRRWGLPRELVCLQPILHRWLCRLQLFIDHKMERAPINVGGLISNGALAHSPPPHQVPYAAFSKHSARQGPPAGTLVTSTSTGLGTSTNKAPNIVHKGPVWSHYTIIGTRVPYFK